MINQLREIIATSLYWVADRISPIKCRIRYLFNQARKNNVRIL